MNEPSQVMDKRRARLNKIILHAARIPLIYLFIGTALIGLSYIDDIFPITNWKNIFDLTDKIGSIFIALALLTFVYNFIILVCRRYEKRLQAEHKVTTLILATARKGLRIIFLLAVIDIAISIMTPTQHYLVLANDIVRVTLIGALGWVAIQILYAFEAVLQQYVETQSDANRAKALYTKMRILRNITTVAIIIITIAAILMSFNSVRNIGISLLASAGFLTAIIGLSAQKTLFSLFSGLQIALSQPIKIGDIVVIEKESGIVEEITFTYVTLKLGDRRRLMVPINYFIDKPFENWSHEGSSLRSSFSLYVDYMMPITPLRDKLDAILHLSPYWDGLAKKLQVSNINDSCVELRIQISAANADNLADLRAEVREKLLSFIQENYPDYFPHQRSQTITLRGTETN
jgi:small-conductance mechanosensitive channel